MNAIRLSLVLAVTVLSAACNCGGPAIVGSGTPKTDTRTIGPYHRVEVGHGLDVTLTDRPWESLTITSDDNIVDAITTEVKDGVLLIGTKDGIIVAPKDGMTIEVSATTLNELGASGSSHVKAGANAPIICERVALSASGSSHIELDLLTGTELVLWASGASKVDIREATSPKTTFSLSGASEVSITAGGLGDIDAEVSGASKLQIPDLSADNAKLTVSGASQVSLSAAKSVSGNVSGASQVNVKGNPAERTLEISGGSTVKFDE